MNDDCNSNEKPRRHDHPSACGGHDASAPRSPGGAPSAPIDRRAFLKVLGAGAVAASVPAERPLMAGPFGAEPGEVRHFVPADKKLAEEWVRGLFARGERRVLRRNELDTIGMPVGGLCAGQLYLRGDGTLGCWQIFNRHHFSGYGADSYRYRTPDSPVDQGFAVAVEGPGGEEVATLDREGFPDVEFVGEYPIGEVRYARDGFPLRIEMEAFSPFIPLNASDSALPATIFHITLRNASSRTQRARLIGWLENAVCFHSAETVAGRRTMAVRVERGRRLVLHGAIDPPREEVIDPRPPVRLADFEGDDYGDWKAEGEAFGSGPARGTLPGQQAVSGFEGIGLVNTFLGGDGPRGKLTSPELTISRRFINFLLGGGNHAGKTCINLLVDGKVVRTQHGRQNEKLEWRAWNVSDLEGKKAVIQIVDDHSGGWGHINVDRIELADEPRDANLGPVDRLEDYGTMVLALAERGAPLDGLELTLGKLEVPFRGGGGAETETRSSVEYPISERRKAGLSSERASIEPGESRTFTVVLAWHFPNRREGNAYARELKSASDVAHYVLDHQERLAGDTRKWRSTYYDSSLPRWLLDRIHSTVSNVATGTCLWWGNGRFWAWEGVGCCNGTCTHVWNYAHALARLFPELERSAREMQDLSEALHADGLIGFRGVRNGNHAADGQAGTILKCYREHQMSADDSFLRRNWPNIKKALLHSIRQDGDDDGLIENSQHNTFDINFVGANTFVGSLYLAALRAAEEMAREVGEEDFAARLRKIFESGSRLSVDRLFNGEYFIQDVDLEKHPRHQYAEGCLSDQVFGQGWAHQVGLGYIYPREKVVEALRSVWKYNWAPDVAAHNRVHKPERWFVSPGEAGLFTCTWPRSRHLDAGVRYRNEVWTGIEYQVAGHMIREGLVLEGLAICRAVHDRYDPVRHNPYNEVECGDHYARALASWGVLTSLAGFEHHGPRGHLGFAPRITPEDFRSAFTAAEGWGTIHQRRSPGAQTERIAVAHGRLRVRTLAFEVPAARRPSAVRLSLGERRLEATHALEGERLRVELREDLVLGAGEALEVEIS